MTPLDPGFWTEAERQLVDLFGPTMVEAMLTASATAGDELIAAGIDVDWSLVNAGVKRAATDFVETMAQQITKTNLNVFTSEFSEWLDSGEPLQSLSDRLAIFYGPVRGEMIASTETTRAFATANQVTWKQAGLRKQRFMTVVDDLVCPVCFPHDGEVFDIEDSSKQPPLHTRCRCFTSPIIEEA